MDKFEIFKSFKAFLEAYRLDGMDKMYYNLWDKEIAEEEIKKQNAKREIANEKAREKRKKIKELEEIDESRIILTFEQYVDVYDDKTEKLKTIKITDVLNNIPITDLSSVFPTTTTTTSISGSSISLPLN